MYSGIGRPSIPPERLLRAQLLMALYSVRIQYDMLFRWFLDMSMTEAVFDASSFSRNRDRLLEHEVAPRFLQAVVKRARREARMSSEHFSVDGTLIDGWLQEVAVPRSRPDWLLRDDGWRRIQPDSDGEAAPSALRRGKRRPRFPLSPTLSPAGRGRQMVRSAEALLSTLLGFTSCVAATMRDVRFAALDEEISVSVPCVPTPAAK